MTDANPNAAIMAQIAALEARQHRAIRDGLLADPSKPLAPGELTPHDRLVEIETQIAALRKLLA